MNILAINCGSSSQSFKVYQAAVESRPQVILAGKARNVATHTQTGPVIEWTMGSKAFSRQRSFTVFLQPGRDHPGSRKRQPGMPGRL